MCRLFFSVCYFQWKTLEWYSISQDWRMYILNQWKKRWTQTIFKTRRRVDIYSILLLLYEILSIFHGQNKIFMVNISGLLSTPHWNLVHMPHEPAQRPLPGLCMYPARNWMCPSHLFLTPYLSMPDKEYIYINMGKGKGHRCEFRAHLWTVYPMQCS